MKEHLQDLALQIREARSNESHFEALAALVESECRAAGIDPAYRRELEEINEKEVAVYRQAKETGGSAWPEYEHFVSRFEKAVLAATPG
jgi:hypothetical protein